MKINIAIAEDHLLVRQGLVSLLKYEEDLKVLFDVSNGQELIDQLVDTKPDVILLDIRMPIMDGRQALDIIHDKYPGIKVIIISSHYSDGYILEFINAGASGFLPKNCDIEKVIEAIFVVHEQGYYLDDKFSASALAELLRSKNLSLDNSLLTERELCIVKLLCEEKSSIDIGMELFISARTVEWHKKNIFRKTNSKSVVGVVLYAIKQNIVPNPVENFN